MTPYQWTCPFCGKGQIVTDDNCVSESTNLYIGRTRHGDIALKHSGIRCVNDDCNDVTVEVELNAGMRTQHGFTKTKTVVSLSLNPRSSAKPQPEYIPAAIRQDYAEACLIRDDSPKAAATLARRALQGMIRDFCGIRKNTLFAEITTLEQMLQEDAAPKGVEEETIAAIHAVRKIGNIGAHMESDINIIVDVGPGEAQALIDLIELLFEEWYVARDVRQRKLEKILAIDGAKQQARNVLNLNVEVHAPEALPAPDDGQ